MPGEPSWFKFLGEYMFATYPLHHPLVREARLYFYQCRKRSSNSQKCPAFERIYELVCQPMLTVNEIAKRLRMVSVRFRYMFRRHFAPLVGETARQRQARITAHHREMEREKAALVLPDVPWSAQVLEQSTQAGHRVAAVSTRHANGETHVYRDRIRISDHLCYMHPIRKAIFLAPHHRQRHAKCQITRRMLEEAPFQLFPVVIRGLRPDTLVIPSSTILQCCFGEPERQAVVVYIPFRKTHNRRHDQHKRLCVSAYWNTWNLIPRNSASRQ